MYIYLSNIPRERELDLWDGLLFPSLPASLSLPPSLPASLPPSPSLSHRLHTQQKAYRDLEEEFRAALRIEAARYQQVIEHNFITFYIMYM